MIAYFTWMTNLLSNNPQTPFFYFFPSMPSAFFLFSLPSLLPLLSFYHLPFLLLLLPLLLSLLLLLSSDLEFWSDMVLPNNILVWKWLIVCTSLVIRSNESKYLGLYQHQLVRKITQLNRRMPACSQNMWEAINFYFMWSFPHILNKLRMYF